MAESVPVYDPRVEPPPQAAAAKIPWRMGSTQPQQNFFANIADKSLTLADTLVRSEAAHEVARFQGTVDAEVLAYEEKVTAKPDASEQEMKGWAQEAFQNIGKAQRQVKTGIGRRGVSNWYEANASRIGHNMRAAGTRVRLAHQRKMFESDFQRYVDKGDIDGAVTLAENAVTNGLIPEGTGERLVRDAIPKVQRKQAYATATTNPQAILDTIEQKDEGGLGLPQYPALENEDVVTLQNFAQGRINSIEAEAKAKREAELQAFEENLATNYIAKGLYAEAMDLVATTEGLGVDEQSRLISDINTIASNVAKDKTYSEAEKNAAQAQARSLLAARDFKAFDKLMLDEADKLKGVSNSLYAIRWAVKDKPTDSSATRGKESLDAIKRAKLAGDKGKNVPYVARVEKQHNDIELEMYAALDNLGDDATAEQKNETVDFYLDKASKAAAKGLAWRFSVPLWFARHFAPARFQAEPKTTYQDLVDAGIAIPEVTGPDDPVFKELAPGEWAWDVVEQRKVRKN